ncbi:MAG: ATP-binding protein [Candidatus Coatesbacteria bacterium]|nr:MAG: ATP-binding protein [Candidatus Coatesbacteria bacterium]
MEDLSLHLLDIAMNSIRAGATAISLEIVEDREANLLTFAIRDNGCGMTEDQLSRLHDPFFTTRKTRRVGLGLPLLKQAAEQAGGGLTVTSAPGEGTTVEAQFGLDHIDRPPLGDVAATVWSLIVTNPRVEFEYRHARDDAAFEVKTAELKVKLATSSLGQPRLAKALKKYLADNEGRLAEAAAQ